jgi:DNA-binding response OmpR family regulator
MHIALLEDDKALHQIIKEVLEKEGYSVSSFFDGESLINNKQTFDLYILDIMVPNINGLEILQNIETKAIIISAFYNIDNVKKAYKFGAIDFLRKPFFIDELLVKIDKLFPKRVLIKKKYLFLPEENMIKLDGKVIKLSKKESKLLNLLLKNKNQLVTTEEIFFEVYEEADKFSNNALYSLIKRLKQKTGFNIKSIPQKGYKLII